MFLLHVLIIVSSALAAVNSQLGQHVLVTGSMDMLQCYARYVCASREQNVLVLHNNHSDVSRYVACIRSPFVVVNVGPFNATPPSFYFQVPESLEKSALLPYDLVVLLVATLDDMLSYKRFLMELSRHNLSGRFLVVYQLNIDPHITLTSPYALEVEKIFHEARRWILHNIALLQWQDTRVYTYFPYGNGACGKRVRPEVLGQCQQLSLDQLYPAKIPTQFNGCKLTLATSTLPPAVIDPQAKTEQPLVAGYEIALLNIILKRLNCTYNILRTRRGRLTDCSHAYPYYTDTLVWHAPAATPRAQWKGLVQVFQAPLWYTVLAFFLLFSVTWWIMGRAYSAATCIDDAALSYVQCVLGALQVLLNGAISFPRAMGMRFLVVSWILCTLVLVAAYQSQFLSTLLTTVYEKQITNEEELLASDLPILVQRDIVPVFYRYKHSKIIENRTRFFRSLTVPKGHIFLQHALTTKYVAWKYMDTRGKSTVFMFKEPVEYEPMCLPIYQESPILDYTNKMVLLLMENGIVSKLMREVDFSTYVSQEEPVNVQITIHHLDFAFIALLIGYLLATVALLLEKIVWIKMRKRQDTFIARITKASCRNLGHSPLKLF